MSLDTEQIITLCNEVGIDLSTDPSFRYAIEQLVTKVENISEETLDEDEEDVVHYIEILEDSHGNLTWDSSYETLDEFMEVLHIVAVEVQQPVTMTYPLH